MLLGGHSDSASAKYGEVTYLSNEDRVACIRAIFSNSKPTDKVLQLGGGYLQGKAENKRCFWKSREI